MMKQLYSLLGLLLITSTAFGQAKFWTEHTASVLHLENTAEANVFPTKKRTVNLKFDQLSENLAQFAPHEYSGQSGHVVALPMPDGSTERFRMYYSPACEPALQEKFPQIRSYKGFSVDHARWNVRLTVSPLGLKGSIYTDAGEVYIDPIIHGQTQVHASYYVKDYPEEIHAEAAFACGSHDPDHSPIEHLDMSNMPGGNTLRGAGDAVTLKTYRVAIATTGEWTAEMGGKENALARVSAAVDRLNQVYENEAAIRLVLVGNNENVIFEDAQLDPYPGNNRKAGRELLGLNTNVLNRDIGAANYEVGHVFPRACSDVGGVAALGSVCQTNKGNGVTCWYRNDLDYIVVRVFCHEMGHQFSATHTMNLCDRENETLATGYEPGSGSTIMSYGGLCGNQNVVSGGLADRDITYFHANSVQRIYNFSRGLNCGGEVITGNTSPDVSMDYADGFTIPVRTPFVLYGDGVDVDGDALTYCFEQHDAASKNCNLGSPEDECPAFRSYPPHPENYRVFPRFSTIWNNQTFGDRNEVLVDYTREMNFVLTVRDNNQEAGGFGMDTVTFYTDENSGPFAVTYPNSGEDQVAGDIVEITWDVANTNLAPVNCRFVDIIMYRSSAWNDFEVLKAGTDNDGSAWVEMPGQAENGVRIMIMASDNIFFDITNQSFDIIDPSEGGYGWGMEPNYARVCLPDAYTTDIFSSAFGGFQGNITFDVTGGLPAGATYSFGSSTIEASEGTTLTVDLSDVVGKQNAEIEVQGITDSGDTLYRTLTLELISNDYTDLATVDPVSSTQGVGQNPTFSWTAVDDADFYNFQLATSPAFDAASLVQEDYGLTGTSVALNDILDKNTIYYWRVQGSNICGVGPWTIPSVFSTESSSCKNYVSQDVDVTVPKNTTTEFGLTIDVDATINDLNVDRFYFFCEQLQDASMWLISPAGTQVLLARNQCGNLTKYECRFDDIGGRLRCPPIGDNTFNPQGDITKFNGENAKGRWVLKFEITNNAKRAILEGWELEVCVNQTLDAPYLVTNDTMKMKPSENSPIRNSVLLTRDDNNTDSELVYTLLSTPTRGEVQLNGNVLAQGGTFTQDDLNNQRVTYNQLSGQNDLDEFVFTVNDGLGGWTGAHTFIINANEDFPSSVGDLTERQLFAVYPNPTNGMTQVHFLEDVAEDVQIEVHNLQGQVMEVRQVSKGTRSLNLDMRHHAQGVYLVKTQIGPYFYVEKVTLQK